MAKFRGRALLPSQFVWKYLMPEIISNPKRWGMIPQQLRKHLGVNKPENNYPVGQISIRCNEVCNLRCPSCGQWGENGWLLEKMNRGEKLAELSWETTERIVEETKKDKPFYYIWGGEPTLWKNLVPLFRKLGENNLHGSIVTNCHILEPMIEDLVDTGALDIMFISLDGWDEESQNLIRVPAGKKRDNFERTVRCIDKLNEYKAKKGLRFPVVIPITVIGNENYMKLEQIHKLIRDKSQLHAYYYGWFIPEDRAVAHEQVFENRFGFKPNNHRGYIKSVFNNVDPKVCAQQVQKVLESAKGHPSVPCFYPDIYKEPDIARYYSDHTYTAGYPKCHSIYYTIEISPDGRVTPCRDYQDFDCGNINEQGFYDIWHGERYKKFRREMEKGLMPVCTRCCGLQGF